MADEPPLSLTGAWSGEYFYTFKIPDMPMRVLFTATLDDASGALTGAIEEPNTFVRKDVSRLFSTLVGIRMGERLEFTKTIDLGDGEMHSILYEGRISADTTRIEGTWSGAGYWSGPFFMERSGIGVSFKLMLEE